MNPRCVDEVFGELFEGDPRVPGWELVGRLAIPTWRDDVPVRVSVHGTGAPSQAQRATVRELLEHADRVVAALQAALHDLYLDWVRSDQEPAPDEDDEAGPRADDHGPRFDRTAEAPEGRRAVWEACRFPEVHVHHEVRDGRTLVAVVFHEVEWSEWWDDGVAVLLSGTEVVASGAVEVDAWWITGGP